ncbi:MAG TPA: LysM peptidoglycan-binding domain-containing protein, partial [Acidimicrobiales bacterium]
MSTGRGERAIQATVTLVSLVVVIGAVPAVLALLVTVPPRHPVVYDLIAVVGWIAWFVEVAKLVGTVRARIHSGDLSVHDGTRLVDRLAIRIAAALMALGVGGSIAVVSTAGAATPAVVSTATTMAATSPIAPATTTPAPATPPVTQTTYTVAPGDTLWSIAVALYGDGSQWSAIAAANYGRTMGGGQAFVDPSLIYPGWVLTLPNLPTQAVSPLPAPSPGPSNPAPVSVVQPPDPVAHPSPADREPTVPVDHRPEREASERQRSPVPARGGAPTLPELAVLGLG